MNPSWKKWTLVLFSLATVGAVGLIYTSFSQNQSNASNSVPNPQNSAEATTLVSVWDQNIHPYTVTSELTVYRSPSCGCCGEWVKHMEKHGFAIKDIQREDMETLKDEYGVPDNLASCHTAIIDGYVIEGHIPADDVKALLEKQPNITGIAVPGMPLGSPGMESGERKQDFQVVAFGEDGNVEVFQEHRSY